VCVCVCIHTHTHTHTHILNNMETLVGQKNKHGTAVNAACQGILSACRFGLAWQRFVSPFLELQFSPSGWCHHTPYSLYLRAPFTTKRNGRSLETCEHWGYPEHLQN